MLKPFHSVCLAGVGILAVGAYVLLGTGTSHADPPRSTPPQQLAALQDSQPQPREAGSSASKANNSWIGVMLEEGNGQGVRVRAVFPGGPAAFAGVHVGDTLISIAGAPAESAKTASQTIERLTPKRYAPFTIERKGKPIELKVLPESYAEFEKSYVAEMMHRDPRHPSYAEHHGVSDADMSVELTRRLFEQNERLDRTLHEVLKEVQSLKKQVAALQK